MRVTEILHHLLTCHSTLSLGVRRYKLCISKCKVIEVVHDFFHPPKNEKEFLYFWSCKFLPATNYFQGIIHRWFFSWFPQCASLFTCTQLSTRQNKLHGSRRTLHCKPPATLALHYTQHYTQHYCIARHATLPGAAFRGRTRQIDLYFHFIP